MRDDTRAAGHAGALGGGQPPSGHPAGGEAGGAGPGTTIGGGARAALVGPAAVLPTGEQFALRHGDQSAVVTEVGATLRSFAVAGREFLDTFGPEEMSTGGRGQVLAPWPNRLDGGRYAFGGRTHQLPVSEPRTGNASHGLVRWRSWVVLERAAARLTLGLLLHPQPGYPFTLALEVAYSLGPAGLEVRTTARNAGTTPLPLGLGQHPYFTVGTARVDEATLRLPARTALTTDDRLLPTGRAPVAGSALDFRAARPIGATRLDTCFTDLLADPDGRTRVRLAGPRGAPRLTLALDAAYRYLQAYTGDALADPAARRRGIALEPMTCPANAFNSGEGLHVLHPGESFTATWGVGVGEG